MTTVITRGAGSAQALGYAARATAANYIEDVFSTYLYTGNGSTQTITNGIDLSTKGGLVWVKTRDVANAHYLYNSETGISTSLQTNSTGAASSFAANMTSFNSNGFTIGSNSTQNGSGELQASWSFRKQPKFFDVVTYTGNGANRTISHNLGSVPGSIFVKRTDTTGAWAVYHRSLANTEYMVLDTTAAKATGTTYWNSTTPTSSVFSLGTTTAVNANGGTYVAYLFAHDAGGFGASGSDNVISCGSFTADGSGNATVTLGYEPQFVMIKSSSNTSNWWMFDVMRGQPVGANGQAVYANLTDAESASSYIASPTATGLSLTGWIPSNAYIYIAIRRGPMKTPTSGTSVFAPITYTGNSTANTIRTTGIVTDLVWSRARANVNNEAAYDRLRGSAKRIETTTASAETAESGSSIGLSGFGRMDGYIAGADQGSASINFSPRSYINWSFSRAPGFFDVVCYTGTGSARTVTHNLGVVPELMIVKYRSGSSDEDWIVYSAATGNSSILFLNTNDAKITGLNNWNNTTPSSTTFSLGGGGTYGNITGNNYVAYLFASCPGVSKVGSYTGTGTTLQVNCGFTGGARFVLIKRTDSTGDWYVWDSARGIVAGNDPYLTLNSTAAEVTTTDWVDTYSAGFELSSAAGNNANINGATYIYLSVA